MRLEIITPIGVYIASAILALFLPVFMLYGPLIFALLLMLWLMFLKKHVDVYSAEGQVVNKIIIYSCIGGILAIVFAGLLTYAIQ